MADFRTWDDSKLDDFIASGVGVERESAVAERTRRHLFQSEQKSDARHQALMTEVQKLAKPHWVIWATFVAGAIAAVAAVILLFR